MGLWCSHLTIPRPPFIIAFIVKLNPLNTPTSIIYLDSGEYSGMYIRTNVAFFRVKFWSQSMEHIIHNTLNLIIKIRDNFLRNLKSSIQLCERKHVYTSLGNTPVCGWRVELADDITVYIDFSFHFFKIY